MLRVHGHWTGLGGCARWAPNAGGGWWMNCEGVAGAAFPDAAPASDSAAASALTESPANSASLWAATVHSIAALWHSLAHLTGGD